MIFSIPTALSETITFSELGIASEFSSGSSGSTPIGTFYSTSNDYPLNVNVNAYFRTYYKLKVYLNDAQIDSGQIIGNVNFSVTFKNESLKTGKNSIYIVGEPWGVWPFGVQFGNLIIYGTSNISSPSIFLPPPTPTFTPTPSPIQTPIRTPPITTSPTPHPTPTAIAKDITFSELGLASEFSSGTSFRTPNATFYSNSTDYPLEVSVISYFEGPYYLIIYLNDMQVESRKIIEGIQGGKVTFSGKFNNIRKGNNSLYISGYTIGRMEFSHGNKLIIYGDSKISSPSIFLPPTPTPTPPPPSPNESNAKSSVIMVTLVFGFIIFALAMIVRHDVAEKQTRFEQEQRAKGFIKFIDRFRKEKWGTPQQVEIWKREDSEAKSKESLFSMVIESIKRFEPSRKYVNEFGYHIELQGWLKAHFPSAKVEVQTGSSRPDIVIENIAIEVKGPTDNRALDTLTSKCLKYLNHYDNFIIILFEPKFSEKHLDEIWESVKKHAEIVSTNIIILIKNGNEDSYKKYEQFSKSERAPKNQSVPHYYKVLGLGKNSSSDEIKVAYRKLVKIYHPDISMDKETERKFREIQTAYEVLSNPEKRAEYDRFEEDIN